MCREEDEGLWNNLVQVVGVEGTGCGSSGFKRCIRCGLFCCQE